MATRRDENTEATRRALLDAARLLFTERGYAAASIEDIATRARVTRGALYHHFADKRGLFRSVLEELNERVTGVVAARALADGADVWTCVVQGTDAYLDQCLDPAYQRIILLDGPSVLGFSEWWGIAERHGLGVIRTVIAEAMRHGEIDEQPSEPLAHIIHGALHEAAMHIARADDRATARREVGASMLRVLEGLRRPRPARATRRATARRG